MIDKVFKPIAALLIMVAIALAMIAFFDSLKGVYITVHREPAPAPTTATSTMSTTATVPTTTTAAPAPVLYYPLTDEERDLVERVVMAEAGGEAYVGQLAVAQCILNACLLDDLRPAEVIEEYTYTTARPDPTKSVKKAVAAVFDDGVTVFDSAVVYFYAPGLCRSRWHETQDYVTTIGCHRFFREVK